jgi:hypothetical protein
MNVDLFAICCRNRLVVASLILSLTGGTGAAQVLSLAPAAVQATVVQKGSLFSYAYTISNDSASQAGIARVTVDITVPAKGATLPGVGLNNGQGFLDTIAEQVSKIPAPAIVPVALSAPAAAWLCSPAVTGTAQWFPSIRFGLVI